MLIIIICVAFCAGVLLAARIPEVRRLLLELLSTHLPCLGPLLALEDLRKHTCYKKEIADACTYARAQSHLKIGDFLTNRTQRVVIEGTLLEAAPVTYECSLLGTLLFLCYTNDLPTCVSSDIRLFADDCLLYRTIHYQLDTIILHEDLNMLQQ